MMKATLTLLICLVLLTGCFVPSIRADPSGDDPSQRAHKLLDLSLIQNRDDHPRAIQTAHEALALFQSVNDLDGIATAYSLIGQYHFAQNAMGESARYYELALHAWRQLSDLRGQARALIMFGYIDARKGEWLNAVSYLMQAHNLIDDANDPTQMAQIASGLGYVFNESGLPESGLGQYQRAMEYYKQAKHERYYNRAIMLIGYTYFLLGNHPAALKHLQQALTNFESSPEPTNVKLDIAECHEYLGRVYFSTGQYELALEQLKPIPEIYKKSGNPREVAHVEGMLGQIYQQQGSVSRARKSYLEASRILREVNDRVNDASVRFALGRLELDSGNYEAAESYLKDSIANTEHIRSDLKTRVFAAAFSASVHERYEAYIECLMRKHKSQPANGLEVIAFEASELARARSLSELLRDTQTTVLVGVDPQLAQQEKKLRHAIRTTVDQTVSLLATNYKKEDLDKLEGSLTRLREQHKQITAKLRQLNPAYDKFEEPASYSLKQIQTVVIEDDQTVLLEYFLGQNASYVWAITRNSVEVFELPKAELVTSAVRRVYENVSKEPDDENAKHLNQATAELAEMILRPVAAKLTTPRVIIVADGALNYIPFQLLPNPSANHEPLVAKYEVINAPSASILGQLRQEKEHRRPHTKVLAAFGDPVFDSNYAQYKASASEELTASARGNDAPWRRAWRDVEVSADALDPSVLQPLNYTKFELNNLSAIAGSGAYVATRFAASRQMLASLDLSRYAILHFATHGVLHPEKAEYSGFYLSTVDTEGRRQDGFINMQDIYRLNAPVDLVVLSACRTGLGKDVRGEGLIGLTRGFMFAGASSVVSSLWKVDDEATSELMKHFYANMLQKQMRPAEALRAAQNTLRQIPHWQSPHFWAGFTLQGEFRQPIKVPAASGASPMVQNTVGAGLLMTLLAGIGWGYWRRRSPRSSNGVSSYKTLKK
jgi:CHAT domain-containing protein/predicted negative regulator of RcsB-dependent stress response